MTSHNSSPNSLYRWITIILIVLVIAAAAFLGWAYYSSRQDNEATGSISGITAKVSLPDPVEYFCPLDGRRVQNFEATTRRPIIVQVDNAPAARNQSGLSRADIVYEAMAEGDVTRFAAVFDCQDAEVVGPVRSARLIDIDLVPEYQALLSDSGASEGVAAELAGRPDIPDISHPNNPDAYWRVDDRAAPHNLMTSTENIRQQAANIGAASSVSLTPLTFKDDTPAPAVNSISIPYSGIVQTGYTYSAATNSWLRSIGGEPHIDTLTGQQISPKNVIIQYVTITESDIEEDAGGNRGLIYGTVGSGRAVIFRDGQAIEATWSRSALNQMTKYTDATGNPVALNRGQTWIQFVQPDFQASWG